MQSKYDPSDLEISVSPHGGIDEWQWTLSIGDDAPIESGVVKGSRMDGIRAAREERMRLVARAWKPLDDPPPHDCGSVVSWKMDSPKRTFAGWHKACLNYQRPTKNLARWGTAPRV